MQGLSARRGFTGLEIVIILILIAIMGGVLVYGSGFFQKKARDDQRQQVMKGIVIALEAYKGTYRHYPFSGDPIPGGAVISGNNNFNSMMAALGQNGFLDAGNLVDPKFGKLFGEFSGASSYEDGVKFIATETVCEGNSVIAQEDSTGEVFYSYYTGNGREYEMCLLTEDGNVMKFVSPQEY